MIGLELSSLYDALKKTQAGERLTEAEETAVGLALTLEMEHERARDQDHR